jgi:hypothetical protein
VVAYPTADEIRQARDEPDQVIAEIQAVPGFEDFLATPTMADIQEAARDEPLVYLVAATPGGLALVVRDSDVIHVPLDGMTAEAVAGIVSDFVAAHQPYRAGRDGSEDRWEACLDRTTLRQAQQWLRDTTNGDKVEEYRRALAEGAGWLPARAADALMLALEFQDPAAREQDALVAWAGFAYVGA